MSTLSTTLRFAGKAALVTGGSNGIGLAAAKKFAAEGARVAVTGTDSQDLATALQELPQDSLAIKAEAGVLHDTVETMSRFKDAFGHLDILFINETVTAPPSFEPKDDSYLEKIFDVNFRGTFFSIQQAFPLMRRGGSIIINTSWLTIPSWQDEIHTPARWILSATKAAVRAFARTELTPRGIRVNAVSSSPMAIYFDDEGRPAAETWHEMADRLRDQMPLDGIDSWAEEEVIERIAYLASDESLYLLGSEMGIDSHLSRN